MSKYWPGAIAGTTLLLTGCTVADPSVPGQTPEAAPTSVPTAQPASARDGIVGTGTFVSQTAEVTGGVVVKKAGTTYTLYLENYSLSDTSQLTLAVSRDAVPVVGCVSDRYHLAFDPSGQLQPDGGFPLFIDPAAIDPGYLETIVIAKYPSGAPEDGVCYEPTVAVAALDWDLVDPFPDLGPVDDTGTAPGASGLSWTEGGAVLSYKTARGDAFAAIAARFGLTAQQLMYLNPERPEAYNDRVAYTDEVLNLSRADR